MDFNTLYGLAPPHVQSPVVQPLNSMSPWSQDGIRSVTQQARWPAPPQEATECVCWGGGGVEPAAGIPTWK